MRQAALRHLLSTASLARRRETKGSPQVPGGLAGGAAAAGLTLQQDAVEVGREVMGGVRGRDVNMASAAGWGVWCT